MHDPVVIRCALMQSAKVYADYLGAGVSKTQSGLHWSWGQLVFERIVCQQLRVIVPAHAFEVCIADHERKCFCDPCHIELPP